MYVEIDTGDRMAATPREHDEFERIRLVTEIERVRLLIGRYEEHQAYFRDRVEDCRYEVGRLDERLGGQS